jgi:hypothetical protein
MEKPAIVPQRWMRQKSGEPFRWRPFLKALSEVVVSDIEFLATGESMDLSGAESSQIEEKTNEEQRASRREH